MPSRAKVPAARPERAVSWAAVHRFRLRRHSLHPRATSGAWLGVLGAIGGAQAQVPSAAELSLAARVEGLTRADVADAVGPRRAIVRMWCMRRTLFWVPAEDVALFARGTQRRADKELRWARNHGISARELDRLLDAMDASLEVPRTRVEFCGEVAAALGRPVGSRRGYGWGGNRPVPAVKIGRWNVPAFYMLHLYASRRPVCFGPANGGQATFVRVDRWLPGYRDLPQEAAEVALLRRYLAAYGPATPADFSRWAGVGRNAAVAIWGRLEGEVLPVDVDGWAAGILREDAGALTDDPTPDGAIVRLLPHFDTYVLAHEERTHLVPTELHHRVYRNQGWIAPTVLYEGRVVGTWGYTVTGERLAVQLAPLRRLDAPVRGGVRSEAARLAAYLGFRTVEVRFSP